jgi:hypothetical protein
VVAVQDVSRGRTSRRDKVAAVAVMRRKKIKPLVKVDWIIILLGHFKIQ